MQQSYYHLRTNAVKGTVGTRIKCLECPNGMPNGTENSREKRQPPEVDQRFQKKLFENFRSI